MSTDETPTPPTTSVVGRQNLGATFGASSRTASLAGRLKRPAPAPEPDDTPAAPAPDPEPADDVVDAAPAAPAREPEHSATPKRRTAGERATRSAPRQRAKDRDEAGAGGARSTNTNYPVHVPADLVPLFTERRDQEGTSNTLLVFDAIDALVDPGSPEPYARLRDAISADVIGDQPASLFSRAPRRARPTNDGPRARSQLMLRMSEENRAVIEQLVEQTGALDRSHLITVALTHYLTPPTTR
ncbi:hypothetical protein [Cellulomonas marina]|uniref:Ribbon-helix-helix protein, copG family n=1 Tax=Cellulomonas marina TaxID=988821 RepID=A0A1I1AQF8_9CELL|nr:hypothetical protein [Cellulomonas marina]GIG29283.1 hypothetical protein Cma02nite_18830 [Cellulomonas marina]SFB40261.1 hypothetical protein SAMN05421867_12140 [Cellulomonas marina]